MAMEIGQLILMRREAREFFGVGDNYSLAELKRAYRQEAMRCHPDKNLHNQEESTRKMARVTELYKALLMPETDEERHLVQFYEGFII